MTNIKKLFIWYWMFTKRLFRRYSFILILLLIPIVIPCTKIAMEQDSGILTIALYSEDVGDAVVDEIITKLTTEDSIIRYEVYDDIDESVTAVQSQEVDAVWAFGDDMQKRIDEYSSGKSKEPLVTVITARNQTNIQLANEKLFSMLHPYISYSTFENYVYSEGIISSAVSEETVRMHYDRHDYKGSIVKFSRLDATDEEILDENFLISPIRGILSLVIAMCSIAAAMYFLTDMTEGKYDWLSYRKRMAPAFGSCLSAAMVSSLAVLVALFASGIAVKLIEIPAMIMYAFAVTSFALVMCTVFRSPGKLGSAIPGFLIIMVVMCPIFFNVNFLGWLRWFLPPYYYLNAITNADYIYYMAVYSACSYILAYLLNILFNRNERRVSHIS